MPIKTVAIVSSPSLEKWDWRNPELGIGGSETSHVRMAQGLKAAGFSLESFTPTPEDSRWSADPEAAYWNDTSKFDVRQHDIVINYRDPVVFDAAKPAGAKWWFVAQDVDYGDLLTDERRSKIDRYITLCPTHAAYTKAKYPDLHERGALFLSSNGIDSARIRATIGKQLDRKAGRLMFASSPDRGLMLLLEQWFRIRERVPSAELHTFYGFNNMEEIVRLNGTSDWRFQYQQQLMDLLDQPGVVNHGRVGQEALWEHWAQTNVWLHPTDFPETSMITCMEAQALGAIPVINRLWATKTNILDGYQYDGIPQKSAVIRSLMVEKAVQLLNGGSGGWDRTSFPYNMEGFCGSRRNRMQERALDRFDWSNIVKQWSKWIEKDSE